MPFGDSSSVKRGHFQVFFPLQGVTLIHPFGKLALSQPFNSLYPSTPLASYFCAIHLFGELFLCHLSLGELFACRLFNSQFSPPFGELILYRPSLERVIFVPSIRWAHYFRANYLTLHPSIDLASYFYQLFKSLSVRQQIFCYEFTSGSFGHL